MNFDRISAEHLARELHAEFLASGKSLALAESCTGGEVAALLIKFPDASKFFLGSIVAYSNAWKEIFLGVSPETLARDGAVSQKTALEMVEGLFLKTTADFAGAVSGFVEPLKTVFIATGKRGEQVEVEEMQVPLGMDRRSALDWITKNVLVALQRRHKKNE